MLLTAQLLCSYFNCVAPIALKICLCIIEFKRIHIE